MSGTKILIDPDDPLASAEELIANAIEVVDEIRHTIETEEGRIPMVIDTDPEWLDASLEYVRAVLESLQGRMEADK
jgi:hypothetical protein